MQERKDNAENAQIILDKIFNFVENGLELVGCTAVEDQMQDQVEETIKSI